MIHSLRRAARTVALMVVVAAMPVHAKPGDAPLTPELLSKTIACESAEGLGPLVPLVMGRATPSWLTKTEKDSSLGIYVYDLQQTIDVLGQTRAQVALHKQWVSVVLPDATDLPAIAETLKLKRAPYGSARQYYRFIGKQGPMLSAYEVLENPFEAIGKTDLSQVKKKVLLGCNYMSITEAQFLDIAKEADAMMKEMADQMRKNLQQAAGADNKK